MRRERGSGNIGVIRFTHPPYAPALNSLKTHECKAILASRSGLVLSPVKEHKFERISPLKVKETHFFLREKKKLESPTVYHTVKNNSTLKTKILMMATLFYDL